MRTHGLYLAIILPFLFMSKLQSQVFAETEGGIRILVFDDGTWTFPGEKKPECLPVSPKERWIYSWKEGNLIYTKVEYEEKVLLISDSIEVGNTRMDTIVYSQKYRKYEDRIEIISKEYSLKPVTRIIIGTEVFSLVGRETRVLPYQSKAEKGYLTSLTCNSGPACKTVYGEFSLEEAKTICSNMYINILRHKMQ